MNVEGVKEIVVVVDVKCLLEKRGGMGAELQQTEKRQKEQKKCLEYRQ